jgi:hypothetical protein
MRRPIIAYMDNGLPVQLLSRRDFLSPDADEKYVPAVLVYIHDTDVGTLNRMLYTQTPEEVVATFPYLSDLEKKVACRALFDQWAWKKLGLEQSLGTRLVTYADDLVVLCRRGSAETALHHLREIMGKLKLAVNEEKTRICKVPERLAAGGRPMLPHLMEWMRQQRFNGNAGDDPGAFDA